MRPRFGIKNHKEKSVIPVPPQNVVILFDNGYDELLVVAMKAVCRENGATVHVVSLSGLNPMMGLNNTQISADLTLKALLKKNRLDQITTVAIPSGQLEVSDDMSTFLTNTSTARYLVPRALNRHRKLPRQKSYLPNNAAQYMTWLQSLQIW